MGIYSQMSEYVFNSCAGIDDERGEGKDNNKPNVVTRNNKKDMAVKNIDEILKRRMLNTHTRVESKRWSISQYKWNGTIIALVYV